MTTSPRTLTDVAPPSATSGNSVAAPAEKQKNEERAYVVLKRIVGASPGAPQTWEFITNINANSTEQAVRRAAEAPGMSFLNPDGPTTLVAVPVRSFNPLTLTVKTETSITIA